MSHGKFKYESRLASEDVARYLESLGAAIRQREVRLESGTDSVSLRVADELSFECSVREDPEKARAGLTLSIEWRKAPSHEAARRSPGLHIVSGSPADEEAVYAEDFVNRDALTPSPGRDPVHDSAPSNAAKMPDDALEKPSARPKAPHPRTTRTKAAARRPAAARTKASVGSRAHARRSVASEGP